MKTRLERRSVLLGLAIFAAGGLLQFATFTARAADTAESEMQKLEGTWVVAEAEAEGRPIEQIRGMKLIFEKGNVIMDGMGRKMTTSYKLNPAASPRHMDFAAPKDLRDAPPMEGIYAWDGEKLRVCFPGHEVSESTDGAGKTTREVVPGKRPTALDSKQGMLMTLKREK